MLTYSSLCFIYQWTSYLIVNKIIFICIMLLFIISFPGILLKEGTFNLKIPPFYEKEGHIEYIINSPLCTFLKFSLCIRFWEPNVHKTSTNCPCFSLKKNAHLTLFYVQNPRCNLENDWNDCEQRLLPKKVDFTNTAIFWVKIQSDIHSCFTN